MNRLLRYAGSLLMAGAMLGASPLAHAAWNYGPMIGGGGGGEWEGWCGRGSISTLRARSGWYVDSIAMMCPSDGYTWSQWYGGGGGGSTVLSCPSNYPYMKGYQGRAGWYIDNLRIDCTDAGKYAITNGNGAAGGTGGAPFTWRCGAGFSVAGFLGGSGWYIDRLALTCNDRPEWSDAW